MCLNGSIIVYSEATIYTGYMGQGFQWVQTLQIFVLEPWFTWKYTWRDVHRPSVSGVCPDFRNLCSRAIPCRSRNTWIDVMDWVCPEWVQTLEIFTLIPQITGEVSDNWVCPQWVWKDLFQVHKHRASLERFPWTECIQNMSRTNVQFRD